MSLSPPTDSVQLPPIAGPPGRRVPAWLMSCVLHAALLILAAMLAGDVGRGLPPHAERVAGIVLTQNSGSHAEYLAASPAEGSAAAESLAAAAGPAVASEVLPALDEVPVDVGGTLPAADGLRALAGGDAASALPNAGGLALGPGPSRSLGGETKAYLFGLEGQGTLFVYVFDRSDSMNGYEGRPLAAARAELVASINSLAATNQFQVIFYNNDVTAFNPDPKQPPRLMFADDTNKAQAEQFVRRLSAFGGTEHMRPLQLALGLAPDVIFFLTDAADPQLSANQLERLRRLNRGTVIHTIEFGAGPFAGHDNFLRRLARQNDGQHTYVDVTRLPHRN